MARRSTEDAAQTREAILDAALVVFADVGFAASQLDRIAAGAGVTRGAVYHHFADKTDLYLTVLRSRWASRLARVVGALEDRNRSHNAAVKGFVVGMVDALNDDPTVQALLRLSMSRDSWLPEIAAHAGEKPATWDRWQELLAARLRATTPAEQAAQRARVVVLALIGYSVERSLAGPEPAARRRAVVRALLAAAGRVA